MASIEYAIDNNGNKIYAYEANRYSNYKCPHCLESVEVRRGNVYVDYFAHSRVEHRTPLQRKCPGYKGNEDYPSINNQIDKMYIDNGGIPLYLSSSNEKFELRAYFPKLSDNVMEVLMKNKVKICVNTDAINNIDKAIYHINNINYYKVNIVKPWIYVSCSPNLNLPEMRRKWLWGIRGIDIKNDIYHSYKDGGYRVALKTNINVGKKYMIMLETGPRKIDGIEFNKIGIIKLKMNYLNTETIVDIFEMHIMFYSEESRIFIESKGYKLLESVNELIPLWPPAVFEGKNLKYEKLRALFLHIDKTIKEKVFCTLFDSYINTLNINSEFEIISITTDNATMGLRNSNDNYIEEIKYNIIKVDNFVNKEIVKLNIIISDSKGGIFNFNNKKIKTPADGKLFITSNLPFVAVVKNGIYVITSSNACFEKVRFFNELIINNRAFGSIKYKYEQINKKGKIDEIDFSEVYLSLYKCTTPFTSAMQNDFELLYNLSEILREDNFQLYRLIEYWVKTNKIPIAALEQIKRIRAFLRGVAYEKNN